MRKKIVVKSPISIYQFVDHCTVKARVFEELARRFCSTAPPIIDSQVWNILTYYTFMFMLKPGCLRKHISVDSKNGTTFNSSGMRSLGEILQHTISGFL